ncbi:jg21174 [Pararge aegeria aegeria]|uniref:Jg21174 protein n=1 Tax=Pararge aegeria aegeria TaxID=348720 RepID=A0A8S4SP94_9NEOP|nr:jg21174 [Pararge aegeria aegeria]
MRNPHFVLLGSYSWIPALLKYLLATQVVAINVPKAGVGYFIDTASSRALHIGASQFEETTSSPKYTSGSTSLDELSHKKTDYCRMVSKFSLWEKLLMLTTA